VITLICKNVGQYYHGNTFSSKTVFYTEQSAWLLVSIDSKIGEVYMSKRGLRVQHDGFFACLLSVPPSVSIYRNSEDT